MHEFLSHPTRHKILQIILGHPEHLTTVEELVYLTGEDSDAVRQQLETLQEAEIVEEYRLENTERLADDGVPTTFYSFSETGVRVIDRYKYLSGLPVMRALYDKTEMTERMQRHRDAPRPELPAVVSTALTIDPDRTEALSTLENTSRANIIADIVGHPDGMPSKAEIDHMNPSLSPSTISEHLNTLKQAGLIESKRVECSDNDRDAPGVVWRVTDEARKIFDQNNLFDTEAYRAAYQEIGKPDEIQAAENADRDHEDF
ncbi:ArsR family transcriptional regulator [Halobium palmae]|uniref:ArsR family transcriptional regulator n=1 Tax=Halobium palmae TaxID=1776492 RepID=A0ABD5RUE9_9EURY